MENYALMCYSKKEIGQLMELICIEEPEHSRICCLENQCQVLCPSSGIADHNDFNLTFFTRIIDVIFGGKYESLVKDMRKIRGTRNVEAIKKFLILTLIIFGNTQQTC